MPKVLPDEFVTDMMDDGEDVHRYRPGGLHPVHLGDLLDGSRYRVVHKLGHGASSTVWLARDLKSRKYVALKIKESDLSNLHNEADILNHLSGATSDHPGRIYSAASLLQRHFWIDGPNGRHLALVCQVLGPSIAFSKQIRLHTHLVGEIVLQVTQGLEYLHSEGICHGDLTSSNVLFQLSNFDSWTEHKLEEQLGKPRKSIIHQRPGRPCYLVDSISFFDALPGVLTKNIIIVDHSESFFVKSPPSHELHTTNHYTAPEVLCGWDASFSSDIWALGCLIYELRSGHPLYSFARNNMPADGILETILLIGKIPSPWSQVQFNQEGYLERDGCEDPVDISAEPPACLLHQQVSLIEDQLYILPEINIRLQGSNPTGSIRNKAFSKIRKCLTKSVPFARTTGVYLIECSSTRQLVKAKMQTHMTPFPKISERESRSLTDLLNGIFKYQPDDRLSLMEIKEHPWLTALLESTHETPLT